MKLLPKSVSSLSNVFTPKAWRKNNNNKKTENILYWLYDVAYYNRIMIVDLPRIDDLTRQLFFSRSQKNDESTIQQSNSTPTCSNSSGSNRNKPNTLAPKRTNNQFLNMDREGEGENRKIMRIQTSRVRAHTHTRA